MQEPKSGATDHIDGKLASEQRECHDANSCSIAASCERGWAGIATKQIGAKCLMRVDNGPCTLADLAFAAVVRAPIAQIEAVKARMGWTFPWVLQVWGAARLRLSERRCLSFPF